MTLDVDKLTIARGGLPVLAGLSFRVAEGQALILRGPNGAGKTTLLRCLAGVQPPLSGTITGAGDRVAYAAHADGLKAMLSVAENLTFWAQVFGARGIDAALTAYDLHALRDRLAGTLSAGQKRRLGLARLLVTGRPLWVLDEPTVSLDQKATGQFEAAMRAHLAAGGEAVIATHVNFAVEAETLDLTGFRAQPREQHAASDEAFL